MKGLNTVDSWLNRIVIVLTGLLLAGMFSITIVNVFLRKFFDINLLWAYDVLRVLFVGFVFFAASVVMFRKEQANFVFVLNKLPMKGRYIFDIFMNVCGAVFYSLIAYFGYKLCISVSNQKMPASGISAVWLYVLMVAAVVIMSIHSLVAAAQDISALRQHKKGEV